jgi:hypothetical protein
MAGFAEGVGRGAASVLALLVLAGCVRDPPRSQFPSASDALARMRETYACSRGVRAEAKVEYFGEGRVRGNVMYMSALLDQLRFDVFSPFGVTLSTLTSDGEQFSLYDLREKTFLFGPANDCNIARFTRVPVPPFALVQMLRGEAPVLVHEPAQASIEWDGWDGYAIRIQSKHGASQLIHLEPTEGTWGEHWQKQQVIVRDVGVAQKGVELYRAELDDHEPAQTSEPMEDPDGIGSGIPPSGPPCAAPVPRKLRLLVPDGDQELVLRVKEVAHNPPLIEGVFRQPRPRGVRQQYADCNR